jgi:integrase
MRAVGSAWERSLRRARIEAFRFHDLRHTWASWHVMRGTTLQELMELGGWKSYEMVLRYAHLASEHLSPTYDRRHEFGAFKVRSERDSGRSDHRIVAQMPACRKKK